MMTAAAVLALAGAGWLRAFRGRPARVFAVPVLAAAVFLTGLALA